MTLLNQGGSSTMAPSLKRIGGSYSREVFDAFLASRREPEWLTALRVKAWDAFERLPFPAGNSEEWMRTDIRLFKLDQHLPALESSEPRASLLPKPLLTVGVDLGGRTSSVDGESAASELDAHWASRGVLFGACEQLVVEHSSLLRPHFERAIIRSDYDKFSALAAAFWSTGTLLYVPRGVHVDQPLHALSAMSSQGVDLSRTLVILEENADATLLAETASGSADGAGMHCGLIELAVGPGAQLRYVNLQNWGDRVWHFAHQKAEVASRGRLQWTIGALGARLAKVNQHVSLVGSDAEAQVNGAMFTQGRQHLCYNTLQHHRAAHCRSDLLYKAALQDDSRTVWRGMIKVDREAQRTDAYQRNDNLILARTARADSIPGLEIQADDVRCTHGSTSGRVDQEQVFYAMARGYTQHEAIQMIVAGFFQQIFDRIAIESVRTALGEAIGKRVRNL